MGAVYDIGTTRQAVISGDSTFGGVIVMGYRALDLTGMVGLTISHRVLGKHPQKPSAASQTIFIARAIAGRAARPAVSKDDRVRPNEFSGTIRLASFICLPQIFSRGTCLAIRV